MIKKNFLFRIKLFLLYFMPIFEGAIHIIISIVGQEHKKFSQEFFEKTLF